MKHMIVGMGEVGKALFSILKEKDREVYGIDLESRGGFPIRNPDIMHITFPYTPQFVREVNNYKKRIRPEFIIIHSTVMPGTTEKIQYVNTFYSPVRGQHDALVKDLKRYDKYIAPEPPERLSQELAEFFNLKFRENPVDLELTKLLDTTQYGILIAWAQEASRIANMFNVPYPFVLEFGRQTFEFYGLRPEIWPGFCGGKCVRQNIALLRKIYKSKFFDAFIDSNRRKAEELGFEDEVNYD